MLVNFAKTRIRDSWQASLTSVARVAWIGFPASLAQMGKGSSESDDPVENDHDLITGEPFSTAPLFLPLTLAARVSLTIKTP